MNFSSEVRGYDHEVPREVTPQNDPMVAWDFENEKDVQYFCAGLISNRIYFDVNPFINRKQSWRVRIFKKQWKKLT